MKLGPRIGVPGGVATLGGAFLPPELPGLAVWLRGDSGTVSSWTDLSGNGRTPTQASGPAQPTINPTGGPNSKPCYVFDGVDDRLVTTFAAYGTAATIFCVAKWNAVFAALDVIFDDNSVNQARLRRDSAGQLVWIESGSISATSQPETNWNYYTVTSNGAASSVDRGLTQIASGNPGAASSKDALTIGSNHNGGAYANCSVAEFIAYGRILSAGESASVKLYLAARYAL